VQRITSSAVEVLVAGDFELNHSQSLFDVRLRFDLREPLGLLGVAEGEAASPRFALVLFVGAGFALVRQPHLGDLGW
jgi:hypothetical protein